MISIIIVTKNRPDHLRRCIKSLYKSTFQNWELLIIDQGTNMHSYGSFNRDDNNRLSYYYVPNRGKSAGLNYGINKAKGDILAFTDDDCIVSKNWLKEINSIFNGNEKISAVFGRSLPYLPSKKKGYICPSVLTLDKCILFTSPPMHRFEFLGNNMAIKKDCIRTIGMFRTWLGVGSKSHAAEDEEMAFRILSSKHHIIIEPKIVIYHNRWLNKDEYDLLMQKYSTGFYAAFTYYALKGNLTAIYYILENFLYNADWFKEFVKLVFTGRIRSALLCLKQRVRFENIQSYIYGTYIGIINNIK